MSPAEGRSRRITGQCGRLISRYVTAKMVSARTNGNHRDVENQRSCRLSEQDASQTGGRFERPRNSIVCERWPETPSVHLSVLEDGALSELRTTEGALR